MMFEQLLKAARNLGDANLLTDIPEPLLQGWLMDEKIPSCSQVFAC